MPADQQPVVAARRAPKACWPRCCPHRITELEETGELNMAHAIDGVGNFRFSAMRQRGTYAAVIRYITTDIPPLDSLGVPAILGDLIMEKARPVAHGGPTGAGKSTTLAAMMDRATKSASGHILTIEDPVEFIQEQASRWSTSARSAPTRRACRRR